MNPLGEMLRNLRVAKYLSVEQVAYRAQIAVSTLLRVEQGKQLPQAPTLQAVLTVLGVGAAQKRMLFALLPVPRGIAQLETETCDNDPLNGWIVSTGDLWEAMRRRNGLKGQQVAERLGISASLVTRWERAGVQPGNCYRAELFSLYGADLGERQALTPAPEAKGGRIHLYSPQSLDTCAEQLYRLREQVDADRKVSGDLRFLTLEAALWPLAMKEPSARELLSETLHWHAEWLLRKGRFDEMGKYINLALELRPHNGRPNETWLAGVTIAARNLAEGRGRYARRHAIRFLESWLPRATEVHAETHLYRDIAGYASAAGDTPMALARIEQAKETASQSTCPRAFYTAAKTHADILCGCGQPELALRILPEFMDESPSQQIYNCLLQIRIFHSLQAKHDASEWLQHVYHLIETHGFPHIRPVADRIAKQL